MPLKYPVFQYIFPPRPATEMKYQSDLFLKLQNAPGWIAEVKANGQRNMIFIDPAGQVFFWNRHNGKHKNYKLIPKWLNDEISGVFKVQPGEWSVIDGELLHNKDSAVKDTLYVWDVLVLNGVHLIGEMLAERKAKLIGLTSGFADAQSSEFIRRITPHIWVAETIPQDQWDSWPELTKRSWIEGFVIKNLSRPLEMGLRSDNNGSWQIRCRKLMMSGHVGKHG
jgi:ATP-dependent DNA ligase